MTRELRKRLTVWLFTVGFVVYSVLLLASLLATSETLHMLLSPSISTVIVLGLFVILLGRLAHKGMASHLISKDEKYEKQWFFYVPDDYLFAPGAMVVYFLTFLWFGDQSLAGIDSLIAFVQATVLGLVLGAFSRPLVPPIPSDLPINQRERYLEHHLSNWWRSAQVAASFLVAFGVGLAAASYLQSAQESAKYSVADLALLSIVTGVSGIILGLYTLAKLYAVGETFRDELAQGTPSE